MGFKDDDEILDSFIEETKEHLQEVENGVIKLESMSDMVNDELIDSMFRAMHSVKAGARLLELENIATIAHGLENVLQLHRQNKFNFDQEMSNNFLKSLDKISELIKFPKLSENVNVSSYVEMLDRLADIKTS
ncbi:MAG: chemotaxis protein CheA [Proteobacteria bacterium]|nr:chemotaxis protein CheA [Pseudomonadota bacterium]